MILPPSVFPDLSMSVFPPTLALYLYVDTTISMVEIYSSKILRLKKARVLHYTKVERLTKDKHSKLSGPF